MCYICHVEKIWIPLDQKQIACESNEQKSEETFPGGTKVRKVESIKIFKRKFWYNSNLITDEIACDNSCNMCVMNRGFILVLAFSNLNKPQKDFKKKSNFV